MTRPDDRAAPRGCIGAVLAVAVVIGLGGWWVHQAFTRDDPLRLASSAADFEPWPSTLDVIDQRVVMGGPVDSGETAPLQERRYITVVPRSGTLRDALDATVAHLTELGWDLDPERGAVRPVFWFAFAGPGPRGERAYVGALSDYLVSGTWAGEDDGADAQLRAAVGDRADDAILVQVFAPYG